MADVYKCLGNDLGVDVLINANHWFTYNNTTHFITDLGAGKVRITRRIQPEFHEIYSTDITSFVDVTGAPLATTVQGLRDALSVQLIKPKAGAGVSIVDNTVSLVAGSPDVIGGYRVGTGLVVDGQGRLSASASSEVTKVLATEAEMLALTTESLRAYRVIRLDTNRLYYLNAGESPAVVSNWFVGPSIESAAVSFNGRTGVVTPEYNDYNLDKVPALDLSTGATFKLVVDSNVLYVQNVSTGTRVKVLYDADIEQLDAKVASLTDQINDASTGLVARTTELENTTQTLDTVINKTDTGLLARVDKLENRPSSGPDYASEITALQAKDVEQDTLILQVNGKADSVANNNVILDQRISTLENRPAGTDYSTQIATLQNKDVAQDTRISATESALLSKAELVAGKVPYEQLPEFPVGRKVNVANKSARLALVTYTDLTIAYESDTGDAWGLDANANPAIEANWSKLGNSQGVGVSSFNGRTGNIGAMAGDYDAGKISELVDKRFVSSDQITDWNAKETTTGAQTKATTAQTNAVATAKTYVDNTFIPLTQMGANSGVAPLDANGKVPVANLPTGGSGEVVIPVTTYNDVKASRVAATWYTNNTAYDRIVQIVMNTVVGAAPSFMEVRNNTTNVIFKIESVTNGGGGGNVVGNQPLLAIVPAGFSYRFTLGSSVRIIASWLELDQSAGSTFVPVSQKGVASGVAPLDTNSRVPLANLPTFLPQTKRVWRDVKASRTVGTWVTNTSNNEMDVHVRASFGNISNRFISLQIRENSSGTVFVFNSNVLNPLGSTGISYADGVTITVPAGWQYQLANVGGSTDALTERWYELY